jgi:hypothetical protein
MVAFTSSALLVALGDINLVSVDKMIQNPAFTGLLDNGTMEASLYGKSISIINPNSLLATIIVS